MSKYLTSDGNNWDNLLSDIEILNSVRDHGLYESILLNCSYLMFDSEKEDLKYIDQLYDYVKEEYIKENKTIKRLFCVSLHQLLMKSLQYSGKVSIDISANNSINDDDLIFIIINGFATKVYFQEIQYEFDNKPEKNGEMYKLFFKGDTSLTVISTENRIIFDSLSKFSLVK